MSNLLPIPSIREVTRIYKARFLFVASSFLFVAGIVAGIILLPSYLIVEKYHMSLEEQIASLSAPAADTADRDLISHIQERVGQLGPIVAATSTPGQMITDALALRPAGISVDHINYSIGKAATVLLSGSSKGGDIVGAYQRALAGSDSFAGVSVPVGALAGVDNGRFNITIIAK